MDMKDNRNLIISILLNLLAVLLTSTLFLFYKVVIAEEINNDLNMENLMLYKDKKELAEKLEVKEKQVSQSNFLLEKLRNIYIKDFCHGNQFRRKNICEVMFQFVVSLLINI